MLKINNRGETLVELAVALAILGAVLASAYAIVNRSFQITQSAKERTQAAYILQSQAEALYALRENMPWSEFRAAVGTGAPFYIREQGGQWHFTADELGMGEVEDMPFATLRLENTSNEADRVDVRITITWLTLGGGQDSESVLYTVLTNPELEISSLGPDSSLAAHNTAVASVGAAGLTFAPYILTEGRL